MRGGGEGRWEGKTTVAHSLSPLPLEKRIPDRKMGSFLKQQLAIKSMAPVMKKVMNSLIRVFCCTEMRQRFRATWRCISLRLNSMIFDFFTTFFGVGERFSYSLSHFLSQTVSILGQRLTRTENKLRECLDNQRKITLQIRPNE